MHFTCVVTRPLISELRIFAVLEASPKLNMEWPAGDAADTVELVTVKFTLYASQMEILFEPLLFVITEFDTVAFGVS